MLSILRKLKSQIKLVLSISKRERDSLLSQFDTLENTYQKLLDELNVVTQQRNSLEEQKLKLLDKLGLATNQRDSLEEQKLKLLDNLGLVTNQRDSLEEQKLKLLDERQNLVSERENIFYKPGHFYSPIPDFKEIFDNQLQIFDATQKTVPGINLNINYQIDLLKQLCDYSRHFPFPKFKSLQYHYYSQNLTFNSQYRTKT